MPPYFTHSPSLAHSFTHSLLLSCYCVPLHVRLCVCVRFFLFIRNMKFPILQRCYMKGEMKCRSCTHVHALACSLTINAFVCNLFLCTKTRLYYFRVYAFTSCTHTHNDVCELSFLSLFYTLHHSFIHFVVRTQQNRNHLPHYVA